MLGGLVQAYCEKGESFDSPFFFIYKVSDFQLTKVRTIIVVIISKFSSEIETISVIESLCSTIRIIKETVLPYT